ncbi:MAG TPA: sulfite exporter TauE/SafE family protein [Bacteroidales bacterium]|nr:sulfite exporter TauE/SafE family protein [Bacteroidales bacterium]
MGLTTLLLLIITGLLAGFVGGAMGVGGGIIIVPALVFILGFTQHEAQGTSLAVLLFPIGILAVINYTKSGYVNYKYAIILILAFVIGSYFGSVVSVHLPDRILKKAFGILMLIVGIRMVFGK